MIVYVDDRERKSNIPSILKRIGVEIEFKRLPVADYIVGDIGIERKDIDDYLSSLSDGRIKNQLYELSYNFEISYLCVIGYVSEALLTRKFNRHAYISSLVGSSLKRAPDGKQGQVITVNLETNYDFAHFIKYLVDKLDNYKPRVPELSLHKKALTDEDRILLIVSSFPNISEIKARNIIKKFKSIKHFINASKEELMEIDGIGDTIASRIYDLVNKEIEIGDSDGVDQ